MVDEKLFVVKLLFIGYQIGIIQLKSLKGYLPSLFPKLYRVYSEKVYTRLWKVKANLQTEKQVHVHEYRLKLGH